MSRKATPEGNERHGSYTVAGNKLTIYAASGANAITFSK